VKTLRLSATLAALILTASTAGAAVTDFGNALGPSGGYTSQAYYRAMLGGQTMTAAQQAYADQEDQLRQLGFQSELGGDFALGQSFYQMAYGLTPGSPGEGLGWLGAFGRGPLAWRSGRSDAPWSTGVSDFLAWGDNGSTVNLPPIAFLGGSVPEPSTWAMMLLGFGSLGYAGWRASRKAALRAA
jgi:PEP-CTERM motif